MHNSVLVMAAILLLHSISSFSQTLTHEIQLSHYTNHFKIISENETELTSSNEPVDMDVRPISFDLQPLYSTGETTAYELSFIYDELIPANWSEPLAARFVTHLITGFPLSCIITAPVTTYQEVKNTATSTITTSVLGAVAGTTYSTSYWGYGSSTGGFGDDPNYPQLMHTQYRCPICNTYLCRYFFVTTQYGESSVAPNTAFNTFAPFNPPIQSRDYTFARLVFENWYQQHLDHPYPSRIEKFQLAQQTQKTTTQVSTWFGNRRRSEKEKGNKKEVRRK